MQAKGCHDLHCQTLCSDLAKPEGLRGRAVRHTMFVQLQLLCLNKCLDICNMLSDSSDCIKSTSLRHVPKLCHGAELVQDLCLSCLGQESCDGLTTSFSQSQGTQVVTSVSFLARFGEENHPTVSPTLWYHWWKLLPPIAKVWIEQVSNGTCLFFK